MDLLKHQEAFLLLAQAFVKFLQNFVAGIEFSFCQRVQGCFCCIADLVIFSAVRIQVEDTGKYLINAFCLFECIDGLFFTGDNLFVFPLV